MTAKKPASPGTRTEVARSPTRYALKRLSLPKIDMSCAEDGRPLRKIQDARRVVLARWAERARELVVAVRLGRASLLLEAAAERVVRVVVGRRKLEHLPELGLGLLPAVDAEVRDPERLADRRLVRLAALRLLERDRRLRGAALLQVGPALLEEVVGLAHVAPRYGKFSSTKSSADVKSRVGPISTPRISAPESIASWNAVESSYGGLPGSGSRKRVTAGPASQSGAPAIGFSGSSSRTRSTRPATIRSGARRRGPRRGSRRAGDLPVPTGASAADGLAAPSGNIMS